MNTDPPGRRAGDGPGRAGFPWRGRGLKNYPQLGSGFSSKSLVHGKGVPTAWAQQRPSSPPQRKARALRARSVSGWYLPVHLALLSHVDLRELAPGGQRVDVADQWQPSRPQQEEQWKGRTSKHRCACLSFWRARNLNCRSPPPWDQLVLQPPRTPRGLKLQFRGHWLAE